jgi:hypothetical protein
MCEDIFLELLKDMSQRFNAVTYNLFNNNSNTFTDECAVLLTDKHIPKDITALPVDFFNS